MQQNPNRQNFAQQLGEFFSRTKASRSLRRSELFQILLSLLIIGAAVFCMKTGSFERFEYRCLDYFFQKRPALKTDDSIRLIEISEESLQAIGQWPWPWHYHAELIKILKQWGAKKIIFDLVFKEDNAPYENDALERAISEAGNVYFSVGYEQRAEKKIWVHSLPIALEPKGDKMEWAHSDPVLESRLKGIGHHHIQLDEDGVLRSVQPWLEIGLERYAQLGLKVAIDELDQQVLIADRYAGKPMLINWPGLWKDRYQHYHYSDVIRSYQGMQKGLKPVISPDAIKDKICFVGLTATDNANFSVNAMEPQVPRLAVHAAIFNQMMTGQSLIPAPVIWNLAVIVMIGLIASFLFIEFNNIRSFIAGLGLVTGWVVIAFISFWKFGIWFYVFQPAVLVLLLFIVAAIYAHIVASREQARLFDLATRDGLTGLFVIRYFREMLNQLTDDALKHRFPLSLILMDIDNFKSINDTYGHPAGDLILKKTAHAVQSCLRSKRPAKEIDLVARYGGEEFIVALHNCPIEEASAQAGERIRKAVESNFYEWEGHQIPVTISVGVSSLRKDENIPDFMVRRADEALYEAKRTGKNKVCIAE